MGGEIGLTKYDGFRLEGSQAVMASGGQEAKNMNSGVRSKQELYQSSAQTRRFFVLLII